MPSRREAVVRIDHLICCCAYSCHVGLSVTILGPSTLPTLGNHCHLLVIFHISPSPRTSFLRLGHTVTIPSILHFNSASHVKAEAQRRGLDRDKGCIIYIYIISFASGEGEAIPVTTSIRLPPVKVGDSIPSVELVEGTPGNKVNLVNELEGKGLIIGVPAACSKYFAPQSAILPARALTTGFNNRRRYLCDFQKAG